MSGSLRISHGRLSIACTKAPLRWNVLTIIPLFSRVPDSRPQKEAERPLEVPVLTGSAYLSTGMSSVEIAANELLILEPRLSLGMTLQWATYRDVSDPCGLSRIRRGIHPPTGLLSCCIDSSFPVCLSSALRHAVRATSLNAGKPGSRPVTHRSIRSACRRSSRLWHRTISRGRRQERRVAGSRSLT